MFPINYLFKLPDMIKATSMLFNVRIVVKAKIVPFGVHSSSSCMAKMYHTSTVLKLSLMISIVLSRTSSNGLTITKVT